MTTKHLHFLENLKFSRPVRFLGELVNEAFCHVFCERFSDGWKVTNVRYALEDDVDNGCTSELGVPHPDDIEVLMEAAKAEVLPVAEAWDQS